MTIIRLHGILAKEYGQNFCLNVGNPKNLLHAIDANRDGFISRIIQLQKEGCVYEIIINKKRLNNQKEPQNYDSSQIIDLVPAITGSGPTVFLPLFGGNALLAHLASAVFFAAVSYALTPTPEVQQIEATAQASKTSMVFSNTVNTASQGAPLPIGYGRLKVGSQVIQATIKSYPQHQPVDEALKAGQEGSNITTSNRR